MTADYAIALGSNRRHGRHGAPAAVLRAAIGALADAGMDIVVTSPIIHTAAIGPAGRGFANAVAIVRSDLPPPDLLATVKAIERAFGRKAGRRWGPRVLDLDLVLWSAGRWPPAPRRAAAGRLTIPHAALAQRDFVLHPLLKIAPAWHAPAMIRHLNHRLTAAKPLPRGLACVGR